MPNKKIQAMKAAATTVRLPARLQLQTPEDTEALHQLVLQNITLQDKVQDLEAQMTAFLIALGQLSMMPGLPDVVYGHWAEFGVDPSDPKSLQPIKVPAAKLTGVMEAIRKHAMTMLPEAVKVLEQNTKVQDINEQLRLEQQQSELLKARVERRDAIPGVKAWISGWTDANIDQLNLQPWHHLDAGGQMDDFLDEDILTELDRQNWLKAYTERGREFGWPIR